MDKIKCIQVASRKSPLAKEQVEEVKRALIGVFPNISFETVFVDSVGDKDKVISLRTLDKTDFFTREIDEMVVSGKCQIAVHSAKDLPASIPEGLTIVAITKGLDPSDSLVLREGYSLSSLPFGATIATSSFRREECVKLLRDDLRFVDIRGTIHERLACLESGETYGVVIAECALIRLGLTHLNRVSLPGETTPLQGQLAIVARIEDKEIKALFASLDSRINDSRTHDARESKTIAQAT